MHLYSCKQELEQLVEKFFELIEYKSADTENSLLHITDS